MPRTVNVWCGGMQIQFNVQSLKCHLSPLDSVQLLGYFGWLTIDYCLLLLSMLCVLSLSRCWNGDLHLQCCLLRNDRDTHNTQCLVTIEM